MPHENTPVLYDGSNSGDQFGGLAAARRAALGRAEASDDTPASVLSGGRTDGEWGVFCASFLAQTKKER